MGKQKEKKILKNTGSHETVQVLCIFVLHGFHLKHFISLIISTVVAVETGYQSPAVAAYHANLFSPYNGLNLYYFMIFEITSKFWIY